MSYKPFGSRWKREMNKLTKVELIDMLQRKLPELSRYKEKMPCGHHPDALMDEYGDGEKWCAACAVKERQP